MQIATVRIGTRHTTGVVDGDELVDLGSSHPDAVSVLVAAGDPDRRELDAIVARSPRLPVDEVDLLPPIPEPRRILCVGTNYADHVAESDQVTERPDHPLIFSRYPSSLVGHEQPIHRPPESTSFDYEGEVAIVIGRTTRRADRATALDAIGGYSCFMDGTIRDWQRHTSQFLPGKTFERTGAWGPWITTADEIDDPTAITLRTELDGEPMQSATTSQLIFDLVDIITYCSTFTTLEPGDVIATGTPGGVGYARDPQRWLTPGSEISVEVSGVGRLSNPVVDEPATEPT